MIPLSRIGLVIVGRNEGDRFRQCLASLPRNVARIVYVDSGSTDASLELARAANVDTLPLCPSRPFTAARGRNEGFDYLCRVDPQIELVQFLDGDCQLAAGWLAAAAGALADQPRVAAVSGRLRELHRSASVYNMLCDTEWNTPVGPAQHFGGNFLIRVSAFRGVGGFDPSIIAAEDSELCVRLRTAGWQLMRLDTELGWHDAAMTRFSQWWVRAVRTGHAFAEGVALHGRTSERHFVRESVSTWVWGCAFPLIAVLLAIPTHGISMLLLGLPLLLVYRIQRGMQHKLTSPKERWQFAAFTTMAKFPQWLGQMKYLGRRLLGRPTTLIEYKGADS